MKDQEAKELLQKYQNGHCTEEEKAQIEAWYLAYGEDIPVLSADQLERMDKQIFNNLLNVRKTIFLRHRFKIISVAAGLFLGLGTWVYIGQIHTKALIPLNARAIIPGGNRAILTFANGQKINLRSNQTGLVISSDKITYADGSNVVNNASQSAPDTLLQTVTTPRGGMYQVILADGTHVWLNAETTLKFPRSFAGMNNRKIELKGEAYFEVAKDKTHPFYVQSKLQLLRVLGTHFNVSAYPDEYTKSTLLEGSIVIDRNTILKPGDQATKTETSIHVEQIDTDNAVAWKNGEFMFRKEPLQNIMQKIARWYDVEVVYQDQSQAKKLFGGEISRFAAVDTVLNTLQLTGQVNFKIEGRRIMVSSK